MRNVALDLGSRITFCEVVAGEVIARDTAKSLAALEKRLGPSTSPARVAVEACREAWGVAKQLKAWGHEVLLVDTTRVRVLGIGQHSRKTDRIDAELLAREVEKGRIPQAHLLSEPQQQVRLQMGVRRALVEARSSYIVTIRHLLRTFGHRLGGCEAKQFVKKVDAFVLPEEERRLIAPLVEMLKAVEPQLAHADAALKLLVNGDAVVKRLQTAPGVGPIIAAAFVSVVDGHERFEKAHQLESYLGLVPSEFTSGRRKLGAITKKGNGYLRTLLVQGAWSVLRTRRDKVAQDEPLVTWAKQVAARRGQSVAVLALARKLVGILWGMWRTGTEYDGERAGLASAAGAHQSAMIQANTVEQLKAAAFRARVKATLTRERSQPSSSR